MSLLSSIIVFIGISLLVIGLVIFIITIGLLLLSYKLIKKNPALAILVLIIALVISTTELLDPATMALGVISWITAILLVAKEYKKLEKIFK